ncbi:sugar kinase [Bradyrhizobium jicamae]|uniref:Sugar kinase n=1 Tax=Bradyrhizobium jicamae TaxID=280332 RepID=A0ABS5FUM3_9BRAD|nr:sugar kinase [Bradyrhizobium jicamae]MBR0800438.1 sugar kinase [Bradyrhizobium jicamae]
MKRVACIGECMVELRERVDSTMTRSYGGDTLNTAIYLARLGVSVDYVTALGDDVWSDEMLSAWQSEGVGINLVVRLPRRLPGLYVIRTDEKGERRFYYWRDSAPARQLFSLPQTEALCASLASYDLVYFSGITLSLYDDGGRERLFESIARCRKSGGRIAFDTNFRPQSWQDRSAAQSVYRRTFSNVDTLLASREDLELLFDSTGTMEFEACQSVGERILKLDGPACRVLGDGVDAIVTAPSVAAVDTTAAGDSFAAAYLAARLADCPVEDAARAGHRLAGQVVRHPGAVIPRSAMPEELKVDLPRSSRETHS